MAEKQLADMTVEELLNEEAWAMSEMGQATQFNDDSGERRLMSWADKVGDELERRGICRGGLNDGCEMCAQARA